MNTQQSGFYYYIQHLINEKKLLVPYLNHVENQGHYAYCFSLHPNLFLSNQAPSNLQQPLFFNGLKFHNHHISVEQLYQYQSDIHYTCWFIHPKNPSEELKISVFFNRETLNVTRISYRMTNKQGPVIKGEIDQSKSNFNLSNAHKALKTSIHATFTVETLEKIAKNAIQNHMHNLLNRYSSDLKRMIQKINQYHEAFQEAMKAYEKDTSNLYLGKISIRQLEILLAYYKPNKKLIQKSNNITLASLEKQLVKLREGLSSPSMNPNQSFENTPLQAMAHHFPKDSEPFMDFIRKTYIDALNHANVDVFAFIHLQFILTVDFKKLSNEIIKKIETSSTPQRNNFIKIAQLLFQTQIDYLDTLKDHAQQFKPYLGLYGESELDLLSYMFVQKNLEAFCMYIEQGCLAYLPDRYKIEANIELLSTSDNDAKPYLNYLRSSSCK